ncbi:GNAT family N-acetyltransferase [Pseudoruegeria sp. HB172150]|uniref:GNAT family N-acetyltransferase n=1 Tax=Pseudoruegeria sp. HB172150 TaxID=2721164 RepID=UPI001552929C|nr:GNAT family N-acetyltransferase [Pseudoruegeria sp. HB172150]
MSPQITLRRAEQGDIPLLQRWDTAPHVRRAITGDPQVDPEHDWAEMLVPTVYIEHLLALLDDRPFAYFEVTDPAKEPSAYWGQDRPPGLRAIDIWIGDAEMIGRGFGTRAMRLVIERCFADPTVHALLVDPRPDNDAAISFFQSLGFRFTGHEVLSGEAAAVHRFDRAAWTGTT